VYGETKSKETTPIKTTVGISPSPPSSSGSRSKRLPVEEVLEIIKLKSKDREDIGVSINEIRTDPSFGGQLSHSQIMNAINYLQNEGEVYSTIDADHYIATEY
jgi:hypothetical protein